jgi:hypothetical protein
VNSKPRAFVATQWIGYVFGLVLTFAGAGFLTLAVAFVIGSFTGSNPNDRGLAGSLAVLSFLVGGIMLPVGIGLARSTRRSLR